MNWKLTASRRIRAMSPQEARAVIERIAAKNAAVKGATIFHDIRALTGGFNSQSINFYVMRRLGVRAGIIRGPK